MAYSEDLANRVREALMDLPDVEEKKMFQGITFMVNGKMCVTVGKERIMARIDPAIHDEVVEKPGCSTVIMKGNPYKGFVHVNEISLKSKNDLDYWIGLALEYNPRAKASVKTKKKKI